jgi:hypothetical protein
LSLAQTGARWSERPSRLIDPELDSYTAYCIDEAASYLLLLPENGKKPPYLEWRQMSGEERDAAHRRSLDAAWERAKRKKRVR